MKKGIIIFVFLGISWGLFAQSSQTWEQQHPVRYLNGRELPSLPDTTHIKRNGYYIGIGINSSILLGKQGYYLSLSQWIDKSILYFPQSYISCGVNSGYSFYMAHIGKIQFSLNPELALNYYENKYSQQNLLSPFDNYLSSIRFIFISLSVNILPSFYYPINKKSGIALFAGIGLDNNYRISERVITYTLPKMTIGKGLNSNPPFYYNRVFFYGNIIGRIAYYRKINNHHYGMFIGIGLKDITSNIFYQYGDDHYKFTIINGERVRGGRSVKRQTILRYGITYKF